MTARYVMIGGFLGAGKTTALDRFARVLTERGLRVGLITNDQSSGLVDTTVLRSRGFAVEEIAGGCFCCRFPSLKDAADRLEAASRPEIFLAEPVGSCTDLMATVSYPLRRLYGDQFTIAPLSVLLDPERARRILGLAEGKPFSEKVLYVYEKQLEEADLIVVNKIDTLDAEVTAELVRTLSERFPAAEVLTVSAKTGAGTSEWFERVLSTSGSQGAAMHVDYDTYAEGEALLGWVNATYTVESDAPFDGNALLLRLTESLRARIAGAGGEVAHLKMTLDAPGPINQLAVVSVVSNRGTPDLRESLLDVVQGGELIVNLRAELDPAVLSTLLASTVGAETANGLVLTPVHSESFRPGRPVPTHRDLIGSEEAP